MALRVAEDLAGGDHEIRFGHAAPGRLRRHLPEFFPPLVETDPAERIGAEGAGKAEGFRPLEKSLRVPLGAADTREVLGPDGQHVQGAQDLFVVADR